MTRRLLLLSVLVAIPARAAGPFDVEMAERRAEVTRLSGKAEAIVPLLGVLDLWELVDDRAPIAATLDDVIADGKQRQEVRHRAAFLRSIVADRQGDHAKAQSLRAGLGLVTRWQVVGPFDNEGKSAFAQVLPPELDLDKPLDGKRQYPGKERAVAWRAFPERLVTQGLVAFDAALRPEQNVAAMATGWVHVDRPTDAALRVGSTGAVKVWINGKVALARNAYRPVRIDQDAAPVRLAAGWNRVTVKLCAAEGGWGFFLRFTAPDGATLPFTSTSEPPATGVAAADKDKPRTSPVSHVGAELVKAAKVTGPARPQALRNLGVYLHYVAPDDVDAHTAEKALFEAARLAPSTAMGRLLAMAASDNNERRKALEDALRPEHAAKATTGERARALVELGESYSRGHRDRRAEELWRQAIALDADHFPATLKLADLAADRGMPARAAAILVEVEKKHGGLAVGRALAQLADRQGRKAEAERRYLSLRSIVVDDFGILRALYGYARARGDVAAALGRLDEMSAARPELLSVAIDRAELLEGIGRGEDAHRALAAALDTCPDEPRLLERDGKVLHRLGRDDEALPRLARALEVRPQNPELRTYLRQMTAAHRPGESNARASGDDLARQWARPMADVVARARANPAPTRSKGAANGDEARVILDLAATRVHANGLSETFTQRVVEILDERGARDMTDFDIRYTPDTQSVEVKVARVYKKNGEIVEATGETDRDLSEPWYGLYYDVRAQVIEFSHLEPGDIVDVEYVVSDVGRRNLFADYFGELHMLQEDVVRMESVYALITPRARAFYFNQPRLPGLKLETTEKGDERVYLLRADNVPKIESEPGMPGFTDIAAYVHVSTYKTWEEVATWYRGLVAEQLQPDDAIKAAVKEAVKGIPASDERGRIRALYDHVVRKTRYVGLEFGIHGYKPYKVSQIYARKFGDCKDKASLLVVMLKEIGIEASLVLARTRRGGDLDPFPASLAPFDHAIVWVPRHDLFLDGTAEFSGSAELPSQDQDIPVLIVNDPRIGGKGRLARTPVLPADRNRVARQARVTLAATGSAHVELHATVSGEVAHEWRNHYQSPGDRSERFEKAENTNHPGTKVVKVSFPGLEDLERPVEVQAELEVPSWGRPRQRDLGMPAMGHEGELLRSYARLSERSHDLVLGFPWVQEERVTIVLPKGYAPRRLPEARHIEGPFGTFSLTVTQSGREVALTTGLRVVRHRISKSEYAAFRRFCLDVDAAVGQELVLSNE